MKKMFSILLVGIIAAGIMAGCNSSVDSGSKSNGDDVVIDFFHRWPNEPRKSFYDQKIKEFEESHPGVTINVDSVLNDSYKEKIRVLVSNDGLPDIFSSWSDSFAENLVSSGRIKELNDIMNEDTVWSGSILESQYAGFTFDDSTYGIPFTVDGKAFFYNKEIFEENNIKVPKTYDELVDVLEQLKSAGYETPVVEGLTNAWAISHYLGTIFDRVVDPEVREADYNLESDTPYTDEGYIRGLEIFQELTGFMGDVSTAIDHEAARNMFAAGEVPILYMQFAEVGLVQDIGDVDIGFFNFPEVTDGAGRADSLTGAPEGWMLSKDAPKEAVEFLKFLTSEETAQEFTKTDGQLNAVKNGVTEENTSPTSYEAYQIVLDAASTVPWFDNAVDITIADIFMRGGQELATKQKTPEDIMKEVQKEAAKKSE
ncbi:extracellular solute-binding protein [Bacillus infantis]|uniref:ABC transporter substrate-binding protein n=1 Tax=Bacillus infantis TaxID=324767 RepID=UPI000B9A2492|nr:extracellular solute-binding protein [Bacillus infantis]MCK6206367.1 extracellular solute-binding protein [Bacillus infantis]OXT18498.1 ABC transporter substrate-binding protein [Bacillus sp. OG2]